MRNGSEQESPLACTWKSRTTKEGSPERRTQTQMRKGNQSMSVRCAHHRPGPFAERKQSKVVTLSFVTRAGHEYSQICIKAVTVPTAGFLSNNSTLSWVGPTQAARLCDNTVTSWALLCRVPDAQRLPVIHQGSVLWKLLTDSLHLLTKQPLNSQTVLLSPLF